MAEWFKAHAWKVCVPSQVPWESVCTLAGTVGSNPTLSAKY